MNSRTETLLILAGIEVVALVFWSQTSQFHYPDGVFPKAVIVLLGGLGIINVILGMLQHEASTQKEFRERVSFPWRPPPLLVSIGATLAYFLGISLVGFYVATLVFLFGMYGLRDARTQRWTWRQSAIALISAGALSAFLYLTFTVILGVQTPQGYL